MDKTVGISITLKPMYLTGENIKKRHLQNLVVFVNYMRQFGFNLTTVILSFPQVCSPR